MRMFVILLFISFNSYSQGWDSKEFNKSVERWNKSIEGYVKDPSKIKEDLTDKYKNSVKEVVQPIKENFGDSFDKMGNKYKDKAHALKYLGKRAGTYTNLHSGHDFYYNIKYDFDNSLPLFWTEFVEEVPLVVPLKLEINNRIDAMRFYPYLLSPYINNVKYKIRSLK